MGRPQLRQTFSSDAGLTVLLVSLAAVLFVIYPFVPLAGPGRMLVTLGLTVVLIAGSYSLSEKRKLWLLAVGLAAFAILSQWLCNLIHHDMVLAVAYVSTILFLALTAGGVLARVMAGARITTHHLQGAVAVYLMLGLIWGYVYALIELSQPGSFALPAATAGAGENMRELVYFSFVTLTTLGYGDVSPISAGARNLAIVEALVGQLYLVILIASLVSQRLAHSTGSDQGDA